MLVPLLASSALGSVALGLYVYRTVERDQMHTVDGEVTRALNAAITQIGRSGRTSSTEPDGVVAFGRPLQYVVAADGVVIERPDDGEAITDAQLAAIVAGDAKVTIDGNPRYRTGARTRADGLTVVMGFSLEAVDASLASLRRSLLLGGAALLAAQALIVGLVARQVAGPVRRLRAVTHRIASGDFDAEVGPASGPRETAALAEDFGSMLSRLLAALRDRERAAADAEGARSDMERFLADASHELRTPLTAVRGYSELYRSGMLDAAGLDRAMARIGDESERLSSLVSDLLQLVQPADPRVIDRIDLAALASAVVHDLRAAYPTHSITHDLPEGDGCAVQGDAARLHQALLNLAANACQHTPAGTDVCIRVAEHAGSVVLEVVDHGPGVDPEFAERIFQPFTRAEASRSRSAHDGAGLGLAIAQRIVHQHHGTVAVRPTEGGGATFAMHLPFGDISNL